MNTYLDVGVPRIQTYLARSRRLRAHARASASIAELSRHYSAHGDSQSAALTDLLGGGTHGWRFNDELGKVDGVVSLAHRDHVPDDAVAHIAERVLEHLRRAWPGTDLNAVWGSGSSYTDAYRDHIGPALSRHSGLFTVAAAPEVPLARPCQLCEHDAAVDRQRVVEEKLELCVDCLSRGVHLAGGSGGQRGIMAEEVAAYGDPEDGENHLGTVAMDGNAIGALFDGLAEADQAVRRQLSRAVSTATQDALAEATTAIRATGGLDSPTLVHVAGGDDVLVSVPAVRAWRFLRTLLEAFARATVAEIGRLVDTDPADSAAILDRLSTMTGGRVASLPSASAGLVVHHVTYPFSLVVEAAQARLLTAKRSVRGADAAVAWTHLTIDGDSPPSWREPWRLSELEQTAARLSALREVPTSARYTAARLIDPGQPATSWCRLDVHVRRFDRDRDRVRAALTPFLDQARSADDPGPAMTRLLDALTIARWW